MKRKDIKESIVTELGSPVVNVELNDTHLDKAIDDAIRWFNAKKALITNIKITLQSDVQEYELDDDVEAIIDVIREGTSPAYGGIFEDFGIPYTIYYTDDYSALVSQLQYIEMSKRILSADKDFDFDLRKGTGNKPVLIISPVPAKSETAIVVVKKKIDNSNLDLLNVRDLDLIIRYATARAKIMLGRIRSKYDSLPAAQGDRSLDGSTLIEEAKEEIEKLNEDILNSQEPMGFIMEKG